jgi:large subunit ribosomal protein L5
MATRLQERYKSEVMQALMKEFGYTNPMAVPKIEKIVINMGVGREAQTNSKVFDQAAMEVSTVSGQKPVITKAK